MAKAAQAIILFLGVIGIFGMGFYSGKACGFLRGYKKGRESKEQV